MCKIQIREVSGMFIDKESFLQELKDLEEKYGHKTTKKEMRNILIIFSVLMAAICTGFFMILQYFFIG